MISDSIYRDFVDSVKDYNQYKEALEKLTYLFDKYEMKYKGEILPVYIFPFLLTKEINEKLRYVSEKLWIILEKLIDILIKNRDLALSLGISEREFELASFKVGYKKVLQIARFDAFLNGNDIKFVEFNVDSPGSIGYISLYADLLKSLDLLSNWEKIKEDKVLTFELKSALFNAILSNVLNNKDYRGLNLAIVDWHNVGTMPEFIMIKDYFNSKGLNTIIADPRDAYIKSGRLYFSDTPIDIVYKRVVTSELMQKEKECKNFIQAAKDNLAYFVNSFRTRLLSSKGTLEFLSSDISEKYFTKEEVELLKKHIPWTRVIRDDYTYHNNKKVSLLEFISSNKDNLVIKPTGAYGGKDVSIGYTIDKNEWDSLINFAVKDKKTKWVVQERIDITKMYYPVLNGKNVIFDKFFVNISPLMLGGKYSGNLVRLSKSPVINVSIGGGIIPSFVVV